VRPRDQTPVLPKEKKKKKERQCPVWLQEGKDSWKTMTDFLGLSKA
jgi:hypothetical protein